MDNENEGAQVDVVEQEVITSGDESIVEEETITIPKGKYSKMQRKAIAYDAGERAPKTKSESQPQQNITNNTPVKPLDILRDEAFKLYREGYNEDEIDLIIQNGGRKVLENKSHPLTLGLQAAREQRKAEDAASRTSDSASLSEVERKYTPEMLKNMSKAELAKILPHA